MTSPSNFSTYSSKLLSVPEILDESTCVIAVCLLLIALRVASVIFDIASILSNVLFSMINLSFTNSRHFFFSSKLFLDISANSASFRASLSLIFCTFSLCRTIISLPTITEIIIILKNTINRTMFLVRKISTSLLYLSSINLTSDFILLISSVLTISR